MEITEIVPTYDTSRISFPIISTFSNYHQMIFESFLRKHLFLFEIYLGIRYLNIKDKVVINSIYNFNTFGYAIEDVTVSSLIPMLVAYSIPIGIRGFNFMLQIFYRKIHYDRRFRWSVIVYWMKKVVVLGIAPLPKAVASTLNTAHNNSKIDISQKVFLG